MRSTTTKTSCRQFYRIIPAVFALILLLTACTGGQSVAATGPTLDPTQAFVNALLTATYAITAPTPTPTLAEPTATPTPVTPTPDPNRTPPALPATFQTSYLNTVDLPHTYVQDTCEYLKMRWDPNNSVPGTVVMPIMFHSVTDDAISRDYQITHDYLVQLLRDLKDMGFEAIDMQQMADFMQYNAKIPQRSVLLIVDDRHNPEYFETHFIPLLGDYGWKVVNAFISHPNTSQELWDGNARLGAEGWVDFQAHGVVHNIPISNFPDNTYLDTEVYGRVSGDEFIHNELFGPIEAFQQHFNKTPIAYIWPGGGFSETAVQVAHEAGYRLGFTVNPRGPVMFNWVPLADEADPNRPTWLPEGQISDPLMVIPRYWDTDAEWRMDTVRLIGKDAEAYAMQNREAELEYYDIVCKPVLGDIPTQAPAQ
ncbi:MAG: polysaccharide deacetylase family protein [Chloroflexi bacterium]|nr:polysaccharide deacetylase family protein [Chloroflexota bacterium]